MPARERAETLTITTKGGFLIFIFSELSRLINTNDKLKIVYVIIISSARRCMDATFACISERSKPSSPRCSPTRSRSRSHFGKKLGKILLAPEVNCIQFPRNSHTHNHTLTTRDDENRSISGASYPFAPNCCCFCIQKIRPPVRLCEIL